MINRKKLETLANVQDNNCVSIYIPTHRMGHNLEDIIQFKNSLSEAVDQLTERGMNKNEATNFLAKGYELLDDSKFWLHLSDGLAVFIGENSFEYYILPINFHPFVFVQQHFYLRPIIPMMSGKNRFFILALSQNEVRFFEGDQYSVTPVIIEDLVPANMEEALMLDADRNLQGHSTENHKIFHGHGAGKDDKNSQLRDYFNQVDKGLMKMLHDEHVPMIIAAVDYLVPIYQEVSNYSNLMEVHISGNVEHDRPIDLHEKAWAKMEDHFNQRQTDLKETFLAYMASNKASFYIYDIVPAAIEGKIDTLFLNNEAHVWGKYDEDSHKIEIHETRTKDSDCLLDVAAKATYLQGGTVYNVPFVEMPQVTSTANAVYRY